MPGETVKVIDFVTVHCIALNEISSNAKSFPVPVKLTSFKVIVAEVETPEFQIVLISLQEQAVFELVDLLIETPFIKTSITAGLGSVGPLKTPKLWIK